MHKKFEKKKKELSAKAAHIKSVLRSEKKSGSISRAGEQILARERHTGDFKQR